MTDRIKIGLMTPGWPGKNTPNGIATAVFHMAMGLKAIGQTPVVIGRRNGAPPTGIPFIEQAPPKWTLMDKLKGKARLEDQSAISYRREVQAMAATIRTAVERHGLDVVIMEETKGWALPVMQETRLPIIVNLHGPWLLHKHLQNVGVAYDKARESREEACFKAAPGLMSPSVNVMEAVEAAYNLGDQPREVILNPYSADPPSPHDGPPRILFVGRFDRHKGGDTVLAAFSRFAERVPDVRMSFAGPDRGFRQDDGQVQTLKDVLSSLPQEARGRLDVLGPQSTEQVAALRKTHSIALIGSRYENMNYTLLEAMSAAQAIVSTRVGGPKEVLEHNRTALFVPPEDPAAMAAAMERLLSEPKLIEDLGAAARAKVEADFHPIVIAEQTIAFCRRVLAHQTH